MMRSAADFEMPKSGPAGAVSGSFASRRRPQHPVLRDEALWPAFSDRIRPSRGSAVTSLPKQRGLSPVNGAIQDGSDAVITPATPSSSSVAGGSGVVSRGIRWWDTALASRIAG